MAPKRSLLLPKSSMNFMLAQKSSQLSARNTMYSRMLFSTKDSEKKEEKSATKKATEQMKAIMDLIKSVQRTETIKYMCHDSVPLDLEGTFVLPEIPEREIVKKYLEVKQIDGDHLNSFLFDILQDFMVAISAKDYERMGELAEAGFVEKLKKKMVKNDGPE